MTTEHCPLCKKPVNQAFSPFCSKHCQQVDLHRWLGGVYAVSSEERPDQPEDEGSDA